MPERVLILRLSSLGDVILSLSILNDLPKIWEIDWLTSTEYESLVRGHPNLREAYFFNRSTGLRSWLRLVNQLAGNQYTLVVDLHSTLRTRLLQLIFLFINLSRRQKTRFVRVRRYRFRRSLFLILKRFTPKVLRPGQRLVEIQRLAVKEGWLAESRSPLPADLRYLVDSVRAGKQDLPSLAQPPIAHINNQVHIGDSDSAGDENRTQIVTLNCNERIHARDATLSNHQKPRVGLVPSASWRAKEWGTHKFLNLALELRRSGRIPVIFGSPQDLAARQLVQALKEIPEFEFEDATDSYNLKVTAGRITRCELLVSGDSGLAHLSEALGVPVLTIFGPTHPDLGFAPKLPNSRMVVTPLWCSPCSKDGSSCFRPIRRFLCMKQVNLEVDEGGMPKSAVPNSGA